MQRRRVPVTEAASLSLLHCSLSFTLASFTLGLQSLFHSCIAVSLSLLVHSVPSIPWPFEHVVTELFQIILVQLGLFLLGTGVVPLQQS